MVVSDGGGVGSWFFLLMLEEEEEYFVVDRSPGFGFHMWNEVHVAGRWLPLDAVLPPDPKRPGIGAAHLKLTHSRLPDGTGLSELISVAAIQGKLEMKVRDVQYKHATDR